MAAGALLRVTLYWLACASLLARLLLCLSAFPLCRLAAA